MKKPILLFAAISFLTSVLNAQGVYQLWGMTQNGGVRNEGVIFKTDGSGNNFETVFEFDAVAGAYPYGSLTYLNGKLYGMVSYGGPNNVGGFFEVDPVTGTASFKLYRPADINGTSGGSSMVAYDNKLYGIGIGGTSGGVIFEWDPVANIYTKKLDLTGTGGAAPGSANGKLTLVGNKFYGVTSQGGATNEGVLFEWNPTTNFYSKKIDFTGLDDPYPSPYDGFLVEKNGILYGTGISGGAGDLGVIFQWDTASNTYSQNFSFNDPVFNTVGSSPFSGLISLGPKLYGMTLDGGDYGMGLIYEWDPVTNIQQVKYSFDGDIFGRNPMAPLLAFNGKLYGMNTAGGANDKGIFFEFDPVTGNFEKKIDFDGINASFSNQGNGIVAVPAPVASGTPGSCFAATGITIDNSNNYAWVPVTDNNGNAIAEIKANGNNLGTINVELYTHNSTVREDAGQRLYLNRNITVTPQFQPTTPVDIRLYITKTEFEALKTSLNSLGQPSGMNTINDLAIFKNNDGCGAALATGAIALPTTVADWSNGYALTASVSSFSSFYFANSINATLPLQLISFTAALRGDDGVLTWKTTGEINTSHFEIERSVDARDYQVIGKQNTFNSPGTHAYSYVDRGMTSLGTSSVFYRLRQVDIDGRVTYSPVVIINLTNAPLFLFYPNPAGEQATLVFNTQTAEQVKLEIVDATGRLIRQSTTNLPAGRSTVLLDLQDIASGLFYLRVNGKSIRHQRSFVKN